VSDNPTKEAFSDLLAYLEFLETQTRALLQLLKDNGIVTDEKLAPYLEQASKASDVRMRAARARIDHLFSADEEAKPATEFVPQPTNQQDTQAAPQQPTAKSPEGKNEREEKTRLPPQRKEPAEVSSADVAARDKAPEKPAVGTAKQKDAA
jgi:hypothetical protein